MSKINALSEIFSSILFNTTNYENNLKNISSVFSDIITNIDQNNFISINFLDEYKKYPKYPSDFKVINNLDKYNILTIYNSAQNDVQWLLDAINKQEVLNLKPGMDSIPDTTIKDDYGLQTIFFTNLSSELFSPVFYNGLSLDPLRRNYLFKTFGYAIPGENKEFSIMLLYSIYLYLLRNLRYSLRIFENIFSSKAQILRSNKSFMDSFEEYLNENDQKLAESLVKFILSYTYKISAPSGTFLKSLVELVRDKLHELSKIFNDTISIRDSIMSDMILYGSDLFYNYVAAKFANSSTDTNLGFYDSALLESLKNYELSTYEDVLSKYSTEAFKEYLYLVYYYKLKPKKFLNVLQLILTPFITQNMVDRNSAVFNISVLQSYFYKIFGTINRPPTSGLNFNLIGEYLREIVTTNYIIDSIEQERICEFSTRIKMISHYEDIFNLENKNFNIFIDEIYQSIFDFLKNSVQVDPYYEHFFNRKMLFWYLLSCLKRDVLLNKVFNKEEIQLSEIFYDLLTSSTYKINFNPEKMRSRTVQYVEGNMTNIGNLFENFIETALVKKLHNENIVYFLN